MKTTGSLLPFPAAFIKSEFMRRRPIRKALIPPLLLYVVTTLGGLTAASAWAGSDNSPVSVKLESARRAFYRGEQPALKVAIANTTNKQIEGLDVEASLGDTIVARRRVGAVAPNDVRRTWLRIDTGLYRSQPYELRLVASESGKVLGQQAESIVLAPRPQADALPVWLWPHNAYLSALAPFSDQSRKVIRWWGNHGITNLAPGGVWSQPIGWTDDIAQAMDALLAEGLTACIMPDGGLHPDSSYPQDDGEYWFKISSDEFAKYSHDKTRRIANPFHPAVAKRHNDANEKSMQIVADYPQAATAFFNTELVDVLRINMNRHGIQLQQDKLGGLAATTSQPKLVQRGVLADDDAGYQANRFFLKSGSGLVVANRRTAGMIHRYRPDILAINDPYRQSSVLDAFPGIDVISSWTYTNPDPKLMLYVETLRAVTRNTGKIPLSTVTLLNYPGELMPNNQWTMMGPGRLAVTTWINLSRAPKMLGYYFSSNCDPFAAFEEDLKTPRQNVDPDLLPPETYEKLKELSERVFKPLGPMFKLSELSPRRIAMLTSEASGLYGKQARLLGHYANMQPYHLYTVFAMAQLPADMLFEEHVERGELRDYDVLVLPKCEVLPETVYRKILEFQAHGGIVIADQYLVADIPGATRVDFDFTYRRKVNARAIATGRGYKDWNDQLKPSTAQLEQMTGVSALKDQRRMEAYAAELRQVLSDRIPRRVDCLEPTALLSLLEGAGGQTLVVVNDKRDYDQRVGKFKAVLERNVLQTVPVALHDWNYPELFVYDMIDRRQLRARRSGDKLLVDVELDELGGKLLALYPVELKAIEAAPAEPMILGKPTHLEVRMRGAGDTPIAGLQPVRVTITDPERRTHEASGHYCLQRGHGTIAFHPAINEPAGTWSVEIEDLTAGLTAKRSFEVHQPQNRAASANKSAPLIRSGMSLATK
ncbi:MAG: hypothetical protein IT427_08695 [Pirellulales bacterium]|nr:hypothetical protein [Pirellulales bacterium]